ncbi:unnamed protein product [Arabidopsis halleri]
MSDSVSTKKLDPNRKYATHVPLKHGIQRGKLHIVGGFRNVTQCSLVLDHVKEEVKNFRFKKAKVKVKVTTQTMPPPAPLYDDYDNEEEEFEVQPSQRGQPIVKDVNLLYDQMAKRPYLYWLLCAASCIDHMNGYIYSHTSLVNMMRKLTNQRNLHRLDVTMFATSFITLAKYNLLSKNLRSFVNSHDWNDFKWPKEV